MTIYRPYTYDNRHLYEVDNPVMEYSVILPDYSWHNIYLLCSRWRYTDHTHTTTDICTRWTTPLWSIQSLPLIIPEYIFTMFQMTIYRPYTYDNRHLYEVDYPVIEYPIIPPDYSWHDIYLLCSRWRYTDHTHTTTDICTRWTTPLWSIQLFRLIIPEYIFTMFQMTIYRPYTYDNRHLYEVDYPIIEYPIIPPDYSWHDIYLLCSRWRYTDHTHTTTDICTRWDYPVMEYPVIPPDYSYDQADHVATFYNAMADSEHYVSSNRSK